MIDNFNNSNHNVGKRIVVNTECIGDSSISYDSWTWVARSTVGAAILEVDIMTQTNSE